MPTAATAVAVQPPAAAVPRREPSALARLAAAVLRVPLAAKLAGANTLIVLAAWAAAYHLRGVVPVDRRALLLTEGALVVSFAANLGLVLLALRPLRALEATAARVWRGDLAARVPPSPLADRDLARVGDAFNAALDGLVDDRSRARALAAATTETVEQDRARLAYALHDSTAHALAALVYQLRAAESEAAEAAVPAPLRARLDAATTSAREILEDVRALAQTVHPQTLYTRGLGAALEHLARTARAGAPAAVEVEADPGADDGVVPLAATVLYRVAHEAVANALRHGGAARVHIRLARAGDDLVLQVTDDGRGFDLDAAAAGRPGSGLFTMRDRVALVDGRFAVTTRPGAGTRVEARVPHSAPAAAAPRPVRATPASTNHDR